MQLLIHALHFILVQLIYPLPDKMAAISQTTLSNAFWWTKFFNFDRISLKFVPNGPIDNETTSVQVMAWRRTSDKTLPEPMLNQFTNAYMRHKGIINQVIRLLQLLHRRQLLNLKNVIYMAYTKKWLPTHFEQHFQHLLYWDICGNNGVKSW